jgi:hypothetical protein
MMKNIRETGTGVVGLTERTSPAGAAVMVGFAVTTVEVAAPTVLVATTAELEVTAAEVAAEVAVGAPAVPATKVNCCSAAPATQGAWSRRPFFMTKQVFAEFLGERVRAPLFPVKAKSWAAWV